MGKKKKDDDIPKGKPPRQQSAVSKSLGSGAKRHMVVCMELRHAIPKGYENKKNVIAEFTRYADYQGAVRYIVGSEHRTSCACPGCESGAMEDVHKGSRMRSCNSSYLIPDSQCVFSTLVVDRDELATISLARVAYDALVNQSRPVQFRNRQRPVSADIVQRSTRKSTLSKGKKLPITGECAST